MNRGFRSLGLAAGMMAVTFSLCFSLSRADADVSGDAMLRVNVTDPVLMYQVLEAFYGPHFSFGADTRQIRFNEADVSADSVMETIRRFDQAGTFTLAYPIHYLAVDDANQVVSKQATTQMVVSDKINNNLIIGATGDAHLKIALLLANLDRDYGSYRDEVAATDPPIRTRVVWLKNLPASTASDYFREHYVKLHRLFSVSSDTEKNALIMTASPRVLDLAERTFHELDIPDTVGLALEKTVTIPVLYRPLPEVVRIVKTSFHPDIIDQSDVNRSIVVTASSVTIEDIRQFLAQYDFQPPTILVEGTILTVDNTKLRQLGVRHSTVIGRNDGNRPEPLARTTRNNFTDDLLDPSLPNLAYQITGRDGRIYSFSLGALITEGVVEIVHKPHITFLSGGDGSFEANENLPQLTTSQNGTNVTFVKTGLSLKVSGIAIPGDTVDHDGNVVYKIVLNKLRLSDGQAAAPTAVGANVTQSFSEQIFESPQIVDDGQLIIVGGAVNEDRITTYRRIPVLGDIPLLKFLFRSEQTSQSKRERLALLRISVVKPHAYEYKAAQFVISKDQQPIEFGGRVNDSIFEHPLKTAKWSSQIIYKPGGGYFELVHDKFAPARLDEIDKAFKRRIRARIPLIQEWSNLELVKSLIINDSGLAGVLKDMAHEYGITVEQLILIARHQGAITDPVFLIYVDFCRKNNLFSAPFVPAPLTRESRPLPAEPFIMKE